MFQSEIEMIPVLKKGISQLYDVRYFATEFNTGNGVADLVFSKTVNDDPLIFETYGLMSMYIKYFNDFKRLDKNSLVTSCTDINALNKLIGYLEVNGYVVEKDKFIIRKKKYKPRAEKMISIEAKLKDWKSGVNQALRYQFFSHKSYLAFPKQYIHRVDKLLLKHYNIGLIAVDNENIEIIFDPKEKRPEDLTSYYFLSECFARRVKHLS